MSAVPWVESDIDIDIDTDTDAAITGDVDGAVDHAVVQADAPVLDLTRADVVIDLRDRQSPVVPKPEKRFRVVEDGQVLVASSTHRGEQVFEQAKRFRPIVISASLAFSLLVIYGLLVMATVLI